MLSAAEGGISFLRKELEASRARIHLLEKENQDLRQEVSCLKEQVNKLKAHDVERKTILWKKLQNSMESKVSEICTKKLSPMSQVEVSESNSVFEKLNSKGDFSENVVKNGRLAALQKPPAIRPNSGHKETYGSKMLPVLAPAAPPPPPPPPSKLHGGSKAVRRVPEVMEFYRSLMKREIQKENKSSTIGSLQDMNPRNMIGEIENRSTYLLSIKSDVETHGEFINSLSRDIEKATFMEISEVESFVKWLDGELSCLVDERAVLKHFPQWPERKSDALREAACSYRELKNQKITIQFAGGFDSDTTRAFEELKKSASRCRKQ